jgi:NTE family protein
MAAPKPKKTIAQQMTTPSRREAGEVADAVARAPRTLKRTHKLDHRPPFERIALLLQGGGALGAYQAGVYEALAEAGLHPDWVIGISIGAINAALIAGNPREARVARLREFWELVAGSPFDRDGGRGSTMAKGDAARAFANRMSAAVASLRGVPGFYAPRFPSCAFHPPGTVEATSFYDTTPLKATLERLVDFNLINADDPDVRLSLGSVNVQTGSVTYFDASADVIRAEHVMASGALPPGFPAIEIDGRYYWDGGVVSNTPLEWLARNPAVDTLAFQVDLWAAPGDMPGDIPHVMTRMKEIMNSSRTSYYTGFFRELNKVYSSLARLLERLPAEFKQDEDGKYLTSVARRRLHHLVNIVYRPKSPEGASKEFEFSRRSMEERWHAGYYDTVHALRHPEVLERVPGRDAGIFVFDFATGAD